MAFSMADMLRQELLSGVGLFAVRSCDVKRLRKLWARGQELRQSSVGPEAAGRCRGIRPRSMSFDQSGAAPLGGASIFAAFQCYRL